MSFVPVISPGMVLRLNQNPFVNFVIGTLGENLSLPPPHPTPCHDLRGIEGFALPVAILLPVQVKPSKIK